MSGSMKWLLYTADDGNQYAVFRDESNAEAAGFDDYTGGTEKPLPQGWRPRGVNLMDTDGNRKFLEIGKPDNDLYTGATNSVVLNGTTWGVSSVRGEKRKRPVAFDSYKDDGDAT